MKAEVIYCCLLSIVAGAYFIPAGLFGQEKKPLFLSARLNKVGIRCHKLICTKNSTVVVITSAGMASLRGRTFNLAPVATTNLSGTKNFRSYLSEDSIKAIAEGPDNLCFYVTHDNRILFTSHDVRSYGWPAFYFPAKGSEHENVLSLWIDNDANLFIGTENNFYLAAGAGKNVPYLSEVIDSTRIITQGEIPVKKILLSKNARVYCFAQDSSDRNRVIVGTDKGMFLYHKTSQETSNLFPDTIQHVTITHMQPDKEGNIWFSTLEKGMGYYYRAGNSFRFYPYNKKKADLSTLYPVNTFCNKSPDQFFVAVGDSLPAIFSTKNRSYIFIDDSSLHTSANKTDDVVIDNIGNLFVIKDGELYQCKTTGNPLLAPAFMLDSLAMAPYLTEITTSDGKLLASENFYPEYLKNLNLTYDQNKIYFRFSVNDYTEKDKIRFAWKMDGVTYGWIVMPSIDDDSANYATVQDLKPGSYVLQIKVRVGKEDWRKQEARLSIAVSPPYWQTWWFRLSFIAAAGAIGFAIVKWRVNRIRKRVHLNAKHEKELLELEAKALRAQMNPHFIFNCMNSIKSLIQQKDEDKAVHYLTTFSKMIRTIFQNSDKREIPLYDELETCRLYTQLESLRFGNKFSYHFHVDESIDLKSVMVPALIVQPFIENAIWHGIVPKEGGGRLSVTVEKRGDYILCIVDDDGIGRALSRQAKFTGVPSSHESKGVHLTQSRLDLDNILNRKNTTVEIVDKKDKDGEATGTTVILTFKEL